MYPFLFLFFSNIEGYNIKPIHVVNKDPKELIKIFVKTLVQIAKQAYKINTKIYKDIYNQIDDLTDHKKKCFQTFDKWIREVPVIGFNSGKYDCNIMQYYENLFI